ncbi:hypothetical protein K7472_04770 [Streptomyces sp. PTM05]|uniref:Deoxyribonuclease NucA/NucB domain-containing protein n=1 Tax=Streptantibioticus parmotrematis TaxID=2873249 RepID=A0ABS7QQT1_9ACTN|nr:hypothetical protein [Streptantibioticus parmotrematis]MBY8884159.1 hypothetical protein [Streptantibioticus parmotrematis]
MTVNTYGRRLITAAASIATVASLALAGTTSARADDDAPPSPGPLLGTIAPSAPADGDLTPAEPLDASSSCTAVAPDRENGDATTECVEMTPAAALAGAPAIADRATPSGATTCVAKPGYFQHTRFNSCLTGGRITYTLRDNKGEAVGTGIIVVGDSASLSQTSTTWRETETVSVAEVTGRLKSLNIAFDVSCDGGCKATGPSPWAGARTLTAGGTASGSVTFSTPVGKGRDTLVTVGHHLYVTSTGAIPTQPSTGWSSPDKVRCDDAVGKFPGCVYPDRRADLDLSLSRYGAAAATYAWAEKNMSDHWGSSGNPLQRLADLAGGESHRASTCGAKSTAPFVPKPASVVPDDSCDEYPFAATVQGGRNGGLCAEVVPLRENGVWKFYEADPKRPVTHDEPCVRAHVPLQVNSAAGGAVGAFPAASRVLEGEKYTVTITA